MISKPANFDQINENGASRKLPMGGYVAIIRKVTDVPDKQYLEIEYDVAEGAYKGIAVDTYEAWGRWSHNFRVYYTDKSMWRFKRFITRCEQTNPNFIFSWDNPACLVNKGIGLVIGYRQYYSSKDGSLKEALDVQDFCTASDVRDDNLPRQPECRAPKEGLPQPKMEEVNLDDGSLPF